MGTFFLDKGFVEASSYRKNVVRILGDDIKTPTRIAREANIRTNHVSPVLSSLKTRGIVVCLNEEARKGRLYKLTEKGQKILEGME